MSNPGDKLNVEKKVVLEKLFVVVVVVSNPGKVSQASGVKHGVLARKLCLY